MDEFEHLFDDEGLAGYPADAEVEMILEYDVDEFEDQVNEVIHDRPIYDIKYSARKTDSSVSGDGVNKYTAFTAMVIYAGD